MSELFPETHSGGEHAHGGGGKKGKILGMPPWLLGVSAAGLILLFIIVRRRSAGGGTAVHPSGSVASGAAPLAYDDPNTVDPNSASGETFSQEGYTTPSAVDSYLAGTAAPSSGPVGLTPQGLPPPSTNTQWGSLVADYLIGQGDDPTLVSNALDAYLHGQQLTQAEQSIVNIAQRTFGEPPEGILPVSTTPAVPPPAPPVPAPSPSPPNDSSSPPHVVSAPFNVRGLNLADASATITNAGWHVNNVSGNKAGVVVSFTPYSDQSVNLGLS